MPESCPIFLASSGKDGNNEGGGIEIPAPAKMTSSPASRARSISSGKLISLNNTQSISCVTASVRLTHNVKLLKRQRREMQKPGPPAQVNAQSRSSSAEGAEWNEQGAKGQGQGAKSQRLHTQTRCRTTLLPWRI